MPKCKPGRLSRSRDAVLTAEQQFRHIAEQQLKRERRYSKYGGAFERPCNFSSKVRIPNRPRRYPIDCSGNRLLGRKPEQFGQIVEMDPRHPLLP